MNKQEKMFACRYYYLYVLRLVSLLVETIVSTRRDTKYPRVCVWKAKLRLSLSAFSRA